MSKLIATFTRAVPHPPRLNSISVKVGSYARTELIEIAAGGALGKLAASEHEQIIDLKALARCWVSIGVDPAAAVGKGHFLDLNERDQFWIERDERVAVIAAQAM